MSETFEAHYKSLNDKQKEAVDTIDGPVMVIAGPGSGKTELLSLRVGNILRKTHVSPHNILCLTFTDNGAVNMRERLLKLIGPDAYRVSIFTFHAFCNHIISRYPEYFYNAATFSQATDIERTELLESIFKSLPHKHPLASFHPDEGYVYMRDVMDRIKHIKSYGYTADEYETVVQNLTKEYDAINAILAAWPERLSMKQLGVVADIATALEKEKGTTSIYLAKTLRNALLDAEAAGKTEALGNWKSKFIVKDDAGIWFKDSYNVDKLLAVAEIYKQYSATMYERGLYDYDDMIIEVAHTLRTNSALRNDLEEQYEYIMIDEFQDTNEAQMSLVRAITGNDIHEGRPNVCVVGDDDQAIYKFQGAEVSHIMHFRDAAYREVKTIVLDKNYRSTADVLDVARHIITQGTNRLETRYEDITKVLSAMNKELPKGEIHLHHFSSDVEEYSHVARTIKKMLDSGTEGSEIAILARGHKELQNLLPYLNRENIPYEYQRRANVFDEPHVRILIHLATYIASVMRHEKTREEVLPELLSHPCFGIDRQELFRLAVDAKERHVSWTQAIGESKNKKVQGLGALLAELAVESETMPLEHVIDAFMQRSGFKEYYFSRDSIKEQPARYVAFLASLKTFIEALREWKDGEQIYVTDVAPFVEMHEDHNISLISESPFMKSDNAVQLMTAHASKGLEFGCVFVISAHDRLWTKPQRVNKAPLPSVLVPLMQPAGDTEDDFIRLFYVAITRAKHTLHITGHDELIRYLPQDKVLEGATESIPIEAHENALAILAEPFKEDEWAIIRKLVKDYRMPVTHMNNFLNICEGGPLYFIEQNLLRFPQPMNPSAVYGSAIHKALEEIIMYPKFHGGERATLPHVVATFNGELSRGRLPSYEEVKERNRGEKLLGRIFDELNSSRRDDDTVEVDMKDEGVIVEGAHLAGKLDLLRTRDNSYEVYDFKTGKAFSSWEDAKSQPDKIKLHMYRQQLIVYKLLLEGSIHYDKKVAKLSLSFVEEDPILELPLDLNEHEVERTKKLIGAVYKKIVTLDFPDTSSYPATLEGITAFEDDLIAGTI